MDSVLSAQDNTLVIWRFSDGKQGHDSQSLGLVNALSRLTPCLTHHIETPTTINTLGCLVSRQVPVKNRPPLPALILGAGHSTHLAVLVTSNVCHSKSLILMRPSLPYSWFDLCLVPDHDNPPPLKNIIPTSGALNTVVPGTNKRADYGLILVGGPSRHFNWQDNDICSMIKKIIHTDQTAWGLFDSPRTPEKTRAYLSGLQSQKCQYFPHRNTPRESIEENLLSAAKIWVTSDSVSMLYEALTSGAAAGVIPVQAKRPNKIEAAIDRLINDNQCVSYKQWGEGQLLKPPTKQLNEADRCAALVLKYLDRGRWI